MTNPSSETRSFDAEISKVLKLMIHSLYTNRDIFLRELISNASDACDKLRYQSLTKPELLSEDSQLKITLSADEKGRTVTISDNGVGMSREDMICNLGTIAKSGTQEFLESLSSDSKKDVPLIGQFGVGFYSAFMVADRVKVISRKAGETESWIWESDGLGQYTVVKGPESTARGTSIILSIKQGKEFDLYLDRFKLGFIAETYSNHISFPIEFLDSEGKVHPLNKGVALWARPKSEITEEQYQEFYRHVGHSPDKPWAVLHNRAEGKIEYTNLLFIPSVKPFDLFHPDRRCRVKLYVRKVFITDEHANIIPAWLRFLRGVVDSEDLPLNISRETLQANPIVDKIRESVVKKVLSDLKKRADKDTKDYESFWNNFGAVLKEGLCETIAPKQDILEVCRFHSTDPQESVTGLDAYISRMKPGQKHIYYLTGDRLEAIQNSPQLEGFKKRGVEVLLFTDHVDDFWVNVVNQYKDKEFKSVTRAAKDLDEVDSPSNESEPKENAQDTKAEPMIEALIPKLKEMYGDSVKDVRITNKLSESPVCLSVGEGDMDIRLEQFLRENKQLPQTAYAKILDINPDHPIIRSLAVRIENSGITEETRDIAFLLLDQAKILEGEELLEPAAFSRRMSYFLARSLAA
jgi:molecular chaperone HtpG